MITTFKVFNAVKSLWFCNQNGFCALRPQTESNMRNCLLFAALALFTLLFGLNSCTSSPDEKHVKSTMQAKQPVSEPEITETTPAKPKSFAPTTRHPEPAGSWSSLQNLRASFTSNAEETNTEKLQRFFARYLPKEELFQIDPKEQTILMTENGTKIAFLDSAFLDDQGNTITTPITIHVKVYNDPLAFLAGNLTTQTADNQLLETGGMIDLRATLDQSDLQIDPEKPAVICFPVSEPKLDGMQTFYGFQTPEGTIRWNLADPKPVAQKKFHLRVYQFTGGLNEAKVDWIIKGTDESLLDWIESQNIEGSELESFLSKHGNQIQTKMEIDRKGKIILTRVNTNENGTLIYELQNLFDKAPELDMESMTDYFDKTEYFISFVGQFAQSTDKIGSRVIRKYGKFKEEIIREFSSAELSGYILEVNQLGRINCDKFSERKEMGDILVKSETPEKAVKVLLVFENFRSQAEGKLTANGWQFDNLPVNTNARIVAFSFNGEQPLMANQKVKIRKGEFSMPEFLPFTYQELELALKP